VVRIPALSSHLTAARFSLTYVQPIFEKYGYGTTIYSPLASSLLTGKYNNGIPPDSRYAKNADISYIKALGDKLDSPEGKAQIGKVQALEAVAKDKFKGVTTAQLALAWVLKNPRVSFEILMEDHGIII
jgi:aryl-alcohol dehydrogenase-like predicted oxidoreductase